MRGYKLILPNLQKRRAVWRLAGDIRGEGAMLLLRLWGALGWPDETATEEIALARYTVSDGLLPRTFS